MCKNLPRELLDRLLSKMYQINLYITNKGILKIKQNTVLYLLNNNQKIETITISTRQTKNFVKMFECRNRAIDFLSAYFIMITDCSL